MKCLRSGQSSHQGTGAFGLLASRKETLGFVYTSIFASPFLFPSLASVSLPVTHGAPAWTRERGNQGLGDQTKKRSNVGNPRAQVTWVV